MEFPKKGLCPLYTSTTLEEDPDSRIFSESRLESRLDDDRDVEFDSLHEEKSEEPEIADFLCTLTFT